MAGPVSPTPPTLDVGFAIPVNGSTGSLLNEDHTASLICDWLFWGRCVVGSGSSIFLDPEDYRAAAGLAADLLVLKPGAFRARLTWIELPALHLLRGRESVRRVAFISLPPERVFAIFPADTTSTLICDGEAVSPGEVVLHGLGERFYQRATGPAVWGSVSLAPTTLLSFSRLLAEREIVGPSAFLILRPSPLDLRHLRRIHTQACRLADTDLDRLAHPEIVRALEQELLEALITCLSSDNKRVSSGASRDHAGLVTRFQHWFRTERELVGTVEDACQALGACRRGLETACLDVLGMPPARYLRLQQSRGLQPRLTHTADEFRPGIRPLGPTSIRRNHIPQS